MRDLDLREKAELLRQLAHPTRLQILQVLSDGAQCVNEIQRLLQLPQTHVSQHLAVLRQARMVDYREAGTLRSYYLSRPSLARALLQVLSDRYALQKRNSGAVPPDGPRAEEETNCEAWGAPRVRPGAGETGAHGTGTEPAVSAGRDQEAVGGTSVRTGAPCAPGCSWSSSRRL
ncbi:MAG: winged helix-turn-helix transcriptional regulator [Deltaproteobacteria bacterium]|nr:winged helix-turn-helix transcriptional regulator [Deltaproteobacteria bacterium]